MNRRGRIWTYTRSSTATEQTVVVTDPQTRQSTYVFDSDDGFDQELHEYRRRGHDVSERYERAPERRHAADGRDRPVPVRRARQRDGSSPYLLPRLAPLGFDGGVRFDVHDSYG